VGQCRWARPGSDIACANVRRSSSPGVRLKAQCGRIQKGARPWRKVTPRRYRDLPSAREFLDHSFLPGAQLPTSIVGSAKVTPQCAAWRASSRTWRHGAAPWREYSRSRGRPTGVRLLVDEGHLHTQIGSQESGGVASRATPMTASCVLVVCLACVQPSGQAERVAAAPQPPVEKAHTIGAVNDAMVV